MKMILPELLLNQICLVQNIQVNSVLILLEGNMCNLSELLPKVPLIVLHADQNTLGEIAGFRNGPEEVRLNQTQVIEF